VDLVRHDLLVVGEERANVLLPRQQVEPERAAVERSVRCEDADDVLELEGVEREAVAMRQSANLLEVRDACVSCCHVHSLCSVVRSTNAKTAPGPKPRGRPRCPARPSSSRAA